MTGATVNDVNVGASCHFSVIAQIDKLSKSSKHRNFTSDANEKLALFTTEKVVKLGAIANAKGAAPRRYAIPKKSMLEQVLQPQSKPLIWVRGFASGRFSKNSPSAGTYRLPLSLHRKRS
ncbi:hypothetical protein AVEN_124610-1 [Araneus ventricosus]|uniref:Uncharacterized protein n=1 Tax=Araneus ventricosus TaxID=182803 RepID=A0A4Y2KT96_ARAVE|nr:hypothetical protein AVEN_124610-1 [Araneus ventricosus]